MGWVDQAGALEDDMLAAMQTKKRFVCADGTVEEGRKVILEEGRREGEIVRLAKVRVSPLNID